MKALSALGLLFAACQLWPRVAHAEHKGQIQIDLRRRWDDGDPTLLLKHLNLMTRNGTLTDEWEAIRQELASLSPVKLSKAFREQHPFDSLESPPWRDAMARIDFESGSRCGTQEIPAPLELLVDEAVRAYGPGRPHVRAPRHRRVAQQKEDVAPDARAPRRDGSRPAARRPQAHRVVSGEEAPAVD